MRHLYSKGVKNSKGAVTELSAFVERPCCDNISSLFLSLSTIRLSLPPSISFKELNILGLQMWDSSSSSSSSSCDLLCFISLRRSRLPWCYGSSILPLDVNRKKVQHKGRFSPMLLVLSFQLSWFSLRISRAKNWSHPQGSTVLVQSRSLPCFPLELCVYPTRPMAIIHPMMFSFVDENLWPDHFPFFLGHLITLRRDCGCFIDTKTFSTDLINASSFSKIFSLGKSGSFLD